MRAGAIFFCAVVFLIAGCAELPRPTTFPFTTQNQLQSATHWQIMAKQGAERGTAPVIFIRKDDNSPFGVAFREYLITELMQINPRFRISNDSSQPVHIIWDTQLVYRNPERLKPEGFPELVLEAAWEFLTGFRWTTRGPLVSHAELILTTRVMIRGSADRPPMELARYSDTFYVNDTDLSNYGSYGVTAQGTNYWRSIAGHDEAWRIRLAREGWLSR
jgi:hypothetical protein